MRESKSERPLRDKFYSERQGFGIFQQGNSSTLFNSESDSDSGFLTVCDFTENCPKNKYWKNSKEFMALLTILILNEMYK